MGGEPKIGTVLAYVGAALLKAIETTELEERVDALETVYQTSLVTACCIQKGRM